MVAMGGALVAVAALAALGVATEVTAVELLVEAPPEYAAEAARLRAFTHHDFEATAQLLGISPPRGPLRLVLAGERSELASRAPSWVSGYALPPMATIVLFPARVPSYPDRTLEALFEHEVAHLLIARAAGGRPLPRWFDEGLATVAAREWDIEDRARFALAVIGPGPRSVAELEEGFLGSAAAARRSYAMSAALLRHLLQRFGPAFVAATLREVAAGSTFESAFRQATGTSAALAAATFFGKESFWNTWVPFLTSTTALWMGITLLTLLAVRARRRRDAAIRARWAEEEQAAALRQRLSLPPDDPSRCN
jgi:hypothetical protein